MSAAEAAVKFVTETPEKEITRVKEWIKTEEHKELYNINWSGNKSLALSYEHPVLIKGEKEKVYREEDNHLNAFTLLRLFLEEEEVGLVIEDNAIIRELIWLLLVAYIHEAQTITELIGSYLLHCLDEDKLTMEEAEEFIRKIESYIQKN